MPSRISTEQAAQAWCKPETEHLTMIPELALVFAEMLDAAYQSGHDDAALGEELSDLVCVGER